MDAVVAVAGVGEEIDQVYEFKVIIFCDRVNRRTDSLRHDLRREVHEGGTHHTKHPDGCDENDARSGGQVAVGSDEALVVAAESVGVPIPWRGIIGAQHDQNNVRIPSQAFAACHRLGVWQTCIETDGSTIATEIAHNIVSTEFLLQ